MTREEAITVLNMVECHGSLVVQAKDMAIEALEQVTSYETTIVKLTHAILEQESKIGQWIIKDDKEQVYDIGGVKTWYIKIMCDKCGFINCAIEGHAGQYHYCPSCGAKMESVDRNE